MTRRLAALALLVLGLCGPRTAAAASRQLELRLIYRVAPGCPAADVFLARLNEHVGYGGNNYLEGSVVVIALGEHAFRLFVQFNGGRVDRLENESCDELVDEAVRTAGLARTDSPVQKAEVQLQRALELGSARGGWTDPSAFTAEQRPAPAPAPPAVAEQPKLERSAEDPAARDGWRPGISAQAHYVAGALPTPALGAGVLLSATYHGVQGRLEGALWPSQPWAFVPGPRAAEVSLAMGSVALGLCSRLLAAELGLGQLQLDGCVRGAFVRLESQATDDFSPGAAQYVALGSRLGIAWQSSGLRVEVMGGLDAARGGPALAPEGGNRFEPQTAQLAASLAVGWQFGGARAEQ